MFEVFDHRDSDDWSVASATLLKKLLTRKEKIAFLFTFGDKEYVRLLENSSGIDINFKMTQDNWYSPFSIFDENVFKDFVEDIKQNGGFLISGGEGKETWFKRIKKDD